MTSRMQQRRDTAANWTSNNPTLAAGELGIETDTKKMKVGDGTTTWTSLTYAADVASQTGNSGKYLTTNGTTTSWSTVDALPSQSGNSGKYLTTNGSAASWATITTDPNPSIFMLMGA